jgi:hypothetical protein
VACSQSRSVTLSAATNSYSAAARLIVSGLGRPVLVYQELLQTVSCLQDLGNRDPVARQISYVRGSAAACPDAYGALFARPILSVGRTPAEVMAARSRRRYQRSMVTAFTASEWPEPAAVTSS